MGTNEDADFMEELKMEFKDTIAKNIVEFHALYNEAKFSDIARIAHDIKGTAAVFELKKGSDIAAELQRSAQDRDAGKTKSLIEELTAFMEESGIVEKK
jgi:HPt (histidine-containing phosphotransfer) domain-containing protein